MKANHSTLINTIDMKYLFFLTMLFCIAATAKAQLPPVRTSDPAGVKTDAASATLSRKADNASMNAIARTIGGTTAVQLPVRTTDNVASSPGATSRTADNASKLPMRTSDGQKTAANVVAQPVPLRTNDPAADASTQKSSDSTNSKIVFPSQKPANDSTRNVMQ